ncbi:MAG: biotin--[acetyl-CoA-carboxylase] ligase [Planctomycetota bacterium]|jgi:BirA family biotin operon repressor/biotin-[acetyl-CoA-carboxylase] ligase
MTFTAEKLDPDKIQAGLKTKRIGGKVIVYDSTTSTNDIAAEYAKNIEHDGLVIFAEQQTTGRGRAGTKWLTGYGDSILCSIVLVENKCSCDLLSLVSAVAVAQAISQTTDISAQVKWPNDILLNRKKVAGILLESKQHEEQAFYILGIGINCNQTKEDFPDEIRKTATSISLETNSTCNRIALIQELLTSLEHWLKIAQKNSKKVISQWQELSILYHHRVKLLYDGKKFSGNCIGIDPQEGLILQLDSGGTRFFHAAQTSIMK